MSTSVWSVMSEWWSSISSPRPAEAHWLNSSCSLRSACDESTSTLVSILICYIEKFDCAFPRMTEQRNFEQRPEALYCPNCAREITDPLTCGDCSAVICRVCGTPLESSADLGIG